MFNPGRGVCDERDKGNSPGESENDPLGAGLFAGGEDNQEDFEFEREEHQYEENSVRIYLCSFELLIYILCSDCSSS